MQREGHEVKDAHVMPIIITGAGLALTAAVAGLVVYVIFQYLAGHPPTTAPSNPMATVGPQIPPAPRIEEHPAIELEQLHKQEDETLSTYGWIDKKAGKVRIPIDRAMELELERGFAAPPAPKEAQSK